MNSTKRGKHGDIAKIKEIIWAFNKKTEFAIGGGNVLLHPQFPEIVEYIKSRHLKHIANITIRYDDIHLINNKKVLEDAIINYVDGIGISVQDVKDLEVIEPFAKKMMREYNKHISIHLIPELLGFKKTEEILKEFTKCNKRINGYPEDARSWDMKKCVKMKALFLGLKQVGRASTTDRYKFSDDEISKLINASEWDYCIDTAFINTYKDWYAEYYRGDEDLFLTRNEGEYSMYIDAVESIAYKSSYDTEKGFPVLNKDSDKDKQIETVFGKIRESCGFDIYKPQMKYYE
jgi:hypothetical protein